MAKYYVYTGRIRFVVEANKPSDAIKKMLAKVQFVKDDFGDGINVNERGFIIEDHVTQADEGVTYKTKDVLHRLGYDI